MKITVSKKDLESALKVSLTTLGGTDAKREIERHLLFRVHGKDKVEIRSFNSRIFSSTYVSACKVEKLGEDIPKDFTIEGKRLNMWIGAVQDAALTLRYDDEKKVIKASSPRGKASFRSLNPDDFPDLDSVFEDAEKTATVSAQKLKAALSHSKQFIFGNESQNASLCVTECRGGYLMATDRFVFSRVLIDDLQNSSLRIHGRDINSVNSFLGLYGDNDIEIREHETIALFKGVDSSVFGVVRLEYEFPKESSRWDAPDHHIWEFKKDDLAMGVLSLYASADWENHDIHLKREEGVMIAYMISSSGEEVDWKIPLSNWSVNDDSPQIDEFVLSQSNLKKVLGSYSGDTVVMGINKGIKRGGWISLREVKFGDKYLTCLCWTIR